MFKGLYGRDGGGRYGGEIGEECLKAAGGRYGGEIGEECLKAGSGRSSGGIISSIFFGAYVGDS